MSNERGYLISTLKRVLAGGELTSEELDTAIPDPLSLERLEQEAWETLSYWADDGDIRAKDPSYEDFRREQLEQRLSNLEAVEAGFLPEEVIRGEHQAWHVPVVGCVITVALIAALLYFMFIAGAFMHGD